MDVIVGKKKSIPGPEPRLLREKRKGFPWRRKKLYCTSFLSNGTKITHKDPKLGREISNAAPLLLVPGQNSNTFHMVGLWKEVKAPNGLYVVLRAVFRVCEEHLHVPSLRMHVARHVDDPSWLKAAQLVQENLITALSWRV